MAASRSTPDLRFRPASHARQLEHQRLLDAAGPERGLQLSDQTGELGVGLAEQLVGEHDLSHVGEVVAGVILGEVIKQATRGGRWGGGGWGGGGWSGGGSSGGGGRSGGFGGGGFKSGGGFGGGGFKTGGRF